MDYTGKTISIRTTFEEDFTGNNFLAMLKFQINNKFLFQNLHGTALRYYEKINRVISF